MKTLAQPSKAITTSRTTTAAQVAGKPTKTLVNNRPQAVAQQKLQQAAKKQAEQSLQRKSHLAVNSTYVPSASVVPIQRTTRLLKDAGLTSNMDNTISKAYQQFDDKILNNSPLAQGNANQVVVWGRSQKTGFRDYGITQLFIGNTGYDENKEEDYDKFEDIWQPTHKDNLKKDCTIRIVIAVSLTLNKSVEQLYATLLHEWFAHAIKWENFIKLVRDGKGKEGVRGLHDDVADDAANASVDKDVKNRYTSEHAAYAIWDENFIREKVALLELDESAENKVVGHLLNDVKRHNTYLPPVEKKGVKRKEIEETAEVKEEKKRGRKKLLRTADGKKAEVTLSIKKPIKEKKHIKEK